MFEYIKQRKEEQLRLERERLNAMSEKELLIEMILVLKKIERRCEYIEVIVNK